MARIGGFFRNYALQRKYLAVLVLLGLVLGEMTLVPLFIDKDAIKTRTSAAFKNLTGLDLDIQGDAVLHSFPLPHVVINALDVHNPLAASQPFLLQVRKMDVKLSLMAFLHGAVSFESIEINGAVLELEHMKNDKMNWKETAQVGPQDGTPASAPANAPANALASKTLPNTLENRQENSFLQVPKLILSDSIIHYTNALNNAQTEWDVATITLTNPGIGKPSSLKGTATYNDKKITFGGTIDNLAAAMGSGLSGMDLTAQHEASAIHYVGKSGYVDGRYQVNGHLAVTLDDVMGWLEDPSERNTATPLPLQLDADLVSEQNQVRMPKITFGGAIKGELQAEMNPAFHIEVKGALHHLDGDALLGCGLFAPAKKDAAPVVESAAVVVALPVKTWFELLDMHENITVDEIGYNHQIIKDGRVEADSVGGELTITKASFLLPGATRMEFTGIGKQGYHGFSLEGELNAAGDDFHQILSLSTAKGIAIPEDDFKRFRLKTNMVLSSHEVRLSEIRVRIENMGIIGGVVANFGAHAKIKAALRMGGVNLDHLVELWGLNQWRAAFGGGYTAEKKTLFLSQWLKQLDYGVDLSGILEQYTLTGKVRDKATFNLSAEKNKIAITKLDTVYNGSHIAGDFSFDLEKNIPNITVNAVTDMFDAAQFFDLPPAPSAAPADRWSHAEMNFQWFELLTLTFHVRAAHVKYGLEADNVDMRGSIGNQLLTIDSLTGLVNGASIAGKVTLTGEKIARLTLLSDMVGVQPERFYAYLPGLTGLSGRYNVTLRANTSGINLFSWVSNLEGTMGIGGRDVVVQQFNLPGIIRAVNYVRTVADILNVVKRAFPGGDTPFSSVEGQWLLGGGGLIKIPNTRLVNPEAIGTFSAQIDLINWKMDGHIVLSLFTLDRAHPPAITINFSGDINGPQKTLDTRLLEEYVTNKTSEKMLQQYVPK